jgi:diketogulonate reductase-like aldo/keto reductase
MTFNQVAVNLSSTITLNDGVVMPLFGLGCYLSEQGAPTENAVAYALQHGYRLIDTAQIYRNEADVGRGIKKSGVKREDIFVVTKVFTESHGYELTTKTVHESLAKLDLSYIDLYLIHAPYGGKNVETYQALLDLQAKGLIRSVGVSNFGVQHLEGLKNAGLPTPSVNQFELHPFFRLSHIVDYCRNNGIAVMGYSPIVQGKKNDDPDLLRISQRLNKSVVQVLIRWSVQRGYITIPKSTKPERIVENSQVFDFMLSDEDMTILNSKPEAFCGWNPTVSPWEG